MASFAASRQVIVQIRGDASRADRTEHENHADQDVPDAGRLAVRSRAWASDGKGHQTGSRNWLFVKVYTDEGIYGVGECSRLAARDRDGGA